jgi:Protein of unknown function (DUF3102)
VRTAEPAANPMNTSRKRSASQLAPPHRRRERPTDVLAKLADRINKSHADFVAFGEDMVERAMTIGDLLIEAKDKTPHGRWQPWLRDNCPRISERTAQVYMQLARARESFAEDPQSAAVFRKVPDLSMAGILKRLPRAKAQRCRQLQRFSGSRVGSVPVQQKGNDLSDEPERDPQQNVTTGLIDALHWLDQNARDAKALVAAFDEEAAQAYSSWEVTSASLRDLANLLLAVAAEWDHPHKIPIRAFDVHRVVDQGPVRKRACSVS